MLASARGLFAERGFLATTVNDIATASRRIPGDGVSAVRRLTGAAAHVDGHVDHVGTGTGTLDLVEDAESLDQVLTVPSNSYLEFWRRYDDIMQLVLATAAHDEDFADITLYHYGPQNGFHFTVTVLGWPEDRAREFLTAQFRHSLRDAATGSD